PMTDTAEPTTAAASSAPTAGKSASASAAASYAELVDGLRESFNNGHTRPLAWRRSQLKAIIAMLQENEADFVRALQEDLGRPTAEAYTADVGATIADIKHTLKHFESWSKPRKQSVPLAVQPAKGRIVPEPLGVVLDIAPWNYPVYLLLCPLAAALAAGNCVV